MMVNPEYLYGVCMVVLHILRWQGKNIQAIFNMDKIMLFPGDARTHARTHASTHARTHIGCSAPDWKFSTFGNN